jgi:hypothetical protein
MLMILKKLDYTYPYHQLIGFYIERAGYPEGDQVLAKEEELKFDFYLSHGLDNPAYDTNWRVFFPKRLNDGPARQCEAIATILSNPATRPIPRKNATRLAV